MQSSKGTRRVQKNNKGMSNIVCVFVAVDIDLIFS